MSKHVVVFLADGFEEIEAVTPVDLLRRAGFTVKMISISNSLFVTGSRGIIIQADKLISEVNLLMAVSSSMLPSAIILPGGLQGAKNLASASIIGSFGEEMLKAGKLVCAICASPVVVLSPLGVLKIESILVTPVWKRKLKRMQEETGRKKQQALNILQSLLSSMTACLHQVLQAPPQNSPWKLSGFSRETLLLTKQQRKRCFVSV